MLNHVRERLNFRDWNPKLKITAVLAVILLFIIVIFASTWLGSRQAGLKPYIESVEAAEGMTLWQLLQSGGIVMVILAALSVATLSLIIYFYLNCSSEKLVPLDFSHDVIGKLRAKKVGLVKELCQENDNIVSSVIRAGLEESGKGLAAVRESVEISAKRETTSVWTTISYLSDVAQVAPMLGLLGTVIGMIQAFNTIAFQSAVVKPILLAGGVSKAMVTTAAGMTIAIVAMIFYSIFRTQAQRITDTVETLASEIIDAFASQERR